MPTLGDAVGANFILAWRAVARSRPFRVAVPTMAVIGAGAPLLAATFFFFVSDHTRVEMLASNLFLWSAAYGLLLLPTGVQRVSFRTDGVHAALTPTTATAAVVGRFAGVFAAYLAVAALLILFAALGETLGHRGSLGPLLAACLPQLALGTILLAAVFLLAQLGGALFTGGCGVLWFVLATQKGGVLASCGDGAARSLATAALSWLPDLGLLRVHPDLIRPTELALMAAHALLFVSLYLLAAILWVRMSWRRAGTRAR